MADAFNGLNVVLFKSRLQILLCQFQTDQQILHQFRLFFTFLFGNGIHCARQIVADAQQVAGKRRNRIFRPFFQLDLRPFAQVFHFRLRTHVHVFQLVDFGLKVGNPG